MSSVAQGRNGYFEKAGNADSCYRLLKMATSRAVVLTFNKFRYFPVFKNRIAKFSTSNVLLSASSFNTGIPIVFV